MKPLGILILDHVLNLLDELKIFNLKTTYRERREGIDGKKVS